MVASDLHVLDDFYRGYGDILDADELRHKQDDFVKEFFPRRRAFRAREDEIYGARAC